MKNRSIQQIISRAAVPSAVGVVITLAAKFGIGLNAAQATPLVTSFVIAVYSAGAHLAEKKWPKAGLLLATKNPTPEPTQTTK